MTDKTFPGILEEHKERSIYHIRARRQCRDIKGIAGVEAEE